MNGLKLKPSVTIDKAREASLWEVHRELVMEAARGREFVVWGKRLGPKPKYFVIGDEPGRGDYISGEPFTGAMADVLVRVVATLKEKDPEVKMTDLYATYLVKTTFMPNELSESDLINLWLPTVQLEYALSGCDTILAVGQTVRLMATHIARTPACYAAPLADPLPLRLRRAWRVLVNG